MTHDLITADRPLRGVVVGAGGLGPFWAKELLDSADTELVGWVDLDAARAKEKAAALAAKVPTGPDLAAMQRAEAPDFVVNVVAPLAHFDVTMAALEGGAAVLSEKPMAPTMREARDMVAAADRAGRLFMVSQNRRYLPTLVAYRETLAKAGALASLVCDFYRAHRVPPGHFLFTLDQPLLLDMAIHLFDAARAVTGADPLTVYAEAYNPPGSWFPGKAAANAIFEMTGGLRFVLNGSWCGDGFRTSWTGSWRAVGEHGSATWDGESATVVDPGPDHEDFTPVPPGPNLTRKDRFDGLHGSLGEFVSALRTGSKPQGECHDNLRSLAMCHAAVESARTGIRVPVLP